METLDIILSARGLPSIKNPPSVFCKVHFFVHSEWHLLYTTETIAQSRDPDWTATQSLHSDLPWTKLMFEVCTPSSVIGSCETSLKDLWASKSLALRLQPSSGFLCINAIITPTNEGVIYLKFGAQNLKNKFFGSSTYLKIYKYLDYGQFLQVHQTPLVNTSKEVEWEEFEVSIRSICNLDLDRLIKIECYIVSVLSSDTLIGDVLVTLNDLKVIESSYNLNEQSLLVVQNSVIEPRYTISEFLSSGTNLRLVVGIDYSSSNKSVSDPSSLHYDGGEGSEYQQCFTALQSGLLRYKLFKHIAVLGFGGVPNWPDDKDCFALNQNPDDPWVNGLEDLVLKYKDTLPHIELSGPTNLAPLISKVASFASEAVDYGDQDYYILAILTDGDISDMPFTIQTIAEASDFPLSIIVFGLGDGNFSMLEFLDSDSKQIEGVVGKYRDIVHYVPYRKTSVCEAHLNRVIVDELPKQFTTFMRISNFIPKKKLSLAKKTLSNV